MDISSRFNSGWNRHYDFADAANIAEIRNVESYDLANDHAAYSTGEKIISPWGSNRVLEISSDNGEEVCVKEIIVNPGYMLSLQRHRGRAELWEVVSGTLGVICDGAYRDVPAGQSVSLPKGAVHCMINPTREPVTVRETQRGICREKDNIRLIDFNNRATYPLTTEVEYASAKLYRDIREKLQRA